MASPIEFGPSGIRDAGTNLFGPPESRGFGLSDLLHGEAYGTRVGPISVFPTMSESAGDLNPIGRTIAPASRFSPVRRTAYRSSPDSSARVASEDGASDIPAQEWTGERAIGTTALRPNGSPAGEELASTPDGSALGARDVFSAASLDGASRDGAAGYGSEMAHAEAPLQEDAASLEDTSHFLQIEDVLKAHNLVSRLSQQVGDLGDVNPDLVVSLNKLRAHLNPKLLDLSDLQDPYWQAETQSQLGRVYRLLSNDGFEEEAARVFEFLH